MPISLLNLNGKLVLGWHPCKNCRCLVRPKKEYCCAGCAKAPGKHSKAKHYRSASEGASPSESRIPSILVYAVGGES